jgi:hypothetical protein
MVIVAQLVRASDCGSEGRGFETRLSPRNQKPPVMEAFFVSLRDDFTHLFYLPLAFLLYWLFPMLWQNHTVFF